MNRPALSLVDEHGEIHADCPRCGELEDLLAEAERAVRGLQLRIRRLERDADAEDRGHPLYPEGERWHAVWREACRHPRCEYGPEEFRLILPFLKSKKLREFIPVAIRGAAFDPYVYRRKNGNEKRCDEFERIFKSKSSLREFCAKAPKETG